jgi:CubicO group peptidase (beta-lactamase class C family)
MTPMPRLAMAVAVGISLGGLCAMARAFEWQTVPAEQCGMSSAVLEAAGRDLQARSTQIFLVIRHDRIVYEQYGPGFTRDTPHYTASLAKALVGGLSLMLALDDGRLTPDDLACRYVPAWQGDPLKSRITLRQLATHYSGIEDAEEAGLSHEELKGWKGAFWKRVPNPFRTARDDAPVTLPPGTAFQYSNPGMAILGYCVTAALRDAPQTDIRALLGERLMGPMGVPDSEWRIGYGAAYELDGLKLYAPWGGGSYSANATARIGRLLLHGGLWDRDRLVGERAVALAIADAGMPTPDRSRDRQPRSGLCWWLNSDGLFRSVPRDLFAGAGAGQQLLAVIPSLDLIIVRNGGDMGREGFWEGIERYVLDPVVAAVTAPPYPPSHVIRGVEFAPEAEVRRAAIGSDNWPITWGDDDAQYAAYGDGNGFEPGTEAKLSLGFARITGGPDGFRGQNLRSESGERAGDGAAGPKASGMLMVGGTLYMLVRNVETSQLAWSEDRGRTWTWGFRFDTSFGCPSFLQFGPGYQGARDGYVYVYSSDGPSAYESYDQVVLARAPKGRLSERAAWQFLSGFTPDGSPEWRADIAARAPVFRYPGRCQRLDVVYDAGLKRYLMALGFDHEGGWGLFDAPEPWGPWTTVFHTKSWGLGGTHGYRLPTKWISPDGKTLHLVFSGRAEEGVNNDAFCVRQMTLETFPTPPLP